MTALGLREREIRELVESVRPGADGAEDDGAGATDAFASASWTVIAEPADELAGTLLAHLGPAAALEALIDDRSPEAIATAVEAVAGPETIGIAQLRTGLARWRPRLSARTAVLAVEQAARFDCRLLLPCDPDWPAGLADLGRRAPYALWTRGRPGLLGTGARTSSVTPDDAGPGIEAVAIVGARAASGYGEHVATEFAAGLVDRGVVVVSGGAYGIDGAAHRGALAGEGTTVAVLAGGLDRFYPAGHESLLRRVAASGALLAEVPCGTPPTRYRFLQRNRVIAALADSVVVVEAGSRSGSLNTAGHAAEIGRPIGAVPGPITSASSAGCHRLLREFPATCVTNVGEVLALHRGDEASDTLPGFDRRSLAELQVLDALRPRQGRDAGELARLSGLAEREVRQVLGRLELEGAVTRGDRGWVRGHG